MFTFLGRLAAQHPWKVCAAWVVVGLAIAVIAPRWDTRAQDDDIRFLPDRCDSVRGYKLLEQAFPRDVYASRVIFALERPGNPLTEADLRLVSSIVADLRKLAADEPDLKIGQINSHTDAFIGKRLLSRDKQCSLIQVSLGSPYLAVQTRATVDRAAAVVRERVEAVGAKAPQLYVTGPAGVGRDLLASSADSLEATTIATVVLVIVILLLVHRAPLLALVPLVTIAFAVWVALNALSLCTLIPGFHLVNVSQIFAVVMLYGAGTDYCLFLIARYREELGAGQTQAQALSGSVAKVGGALAASAGTVIRGLGLMGLAEFAKVRSGGPAIALSLIVALIASLTLAPALLRLLGRSVFWPVGTPRAAPALSRTLPLAPPREGLWERISRLVVSRPVLVWSTAVVLLAPLAYLGCEVKPNYRATGELSQDSSSVLGLQAIQRHFTAGETGPIAILLASHTDWTSPAGQAQIALLFQAMARLDNVAEVRSLTQPLGASLERASAEPEDTGPKPRLASFLKGVKRNLAGAVEDQTRKVAQMFYTAALPIEASLDWLVAPAGNGPIHVTRLDVVLQSDPFDPASVATLDVLRVWIKEELPKTMAGLDGLQAETYGVTVGSRDLAQVTEADRSRINFLVMAAIFLILLVLVRRPGLAAYLLATVLFSYLSTLGATTLFAHWFSGRPLGEVDWRVPFFLFIILVAVGEDYNILLMSRAMKERRRLGGKEGMRRALALTGGTITSCGLIMAGTFATLMLAGLNTLVQIGFALAFGVLLDTFVVRPFLVPAFTVLLWRHDEPVEREEPALLPFQRRDEEFEERRRAA